MKKEDIISALDQRFSAVSVEKVEEVRGITVYVANVMDISGDTATRRNVVFYVMDEGLGTEAAYWHGSDPTKTVQPDEFWAGLTKYLASLIEAGTVEAYKIEALEGSFAVVTSYVASGDDVVIEKLYVDCPGGKWRSRRLVS